MDENNKTTVVNRITKDVEMLMAEAEASGEPIAKFLAVMQKHFHEEFSQYIVAAGIKPTIAVWDVIIPMVASLRVIGLSRCGVRSDMMTEALGTIMAEDLMQSASMAQILNEDDK